VRVQERETVAFKAPSLARIDSINVVHEAAEEEEKKQKVTF
jgi:hypothetical protein